MTAPNVRHLDHDELAEWLKDLATLKPLNWSDILFSKAAKIQQALSERSEAIPRTCPCGAPANYCADCAAGDVRAAVPEVVQKLTIEEAESFAQAEVDEHKSRMAGLCLQLAEHCEKEAKGYLTKCPSQVSLGSRALAFRAAAHRIAEKPHNVSYSAYKPPASVPSPLAQKQEKL